MDIIRKSFMLLKVGIAMCGENWKTAIFLYLVSTGTFLYVGKKWKYCDIPICC